MPGPRDNGSIEIIEEVFCDWCGGVIEKELLRESLARSRVRGDEYELNPELCFECLQEEVNQTMMDS